MQTIYIEKAAKSYPKTQKILEKFSNSRVIEIEKYSELFNRKNQNFRKQKESPSLILAVKQGEKVFKNPDFCASEFKHNYYFSTTLNCPFDCEYCFLQGMYRSANFLHFVNTEDFKEEIQNCVGSADLPSLQDSINFFSSYDNDGLALDHITGFTEEFIPWFKNQENTHLEIRTKSANIAAFKKLKPTNNTTIAFTLSPQEIQEMYEKKTATLSARIRALSKLQKLGWKVAIRVEPLIAVQNWEEVYQQFFDQLKKEINFKLLENIYFGVFKLPSDFLKNMQRLYPKSKLFHNYFERGKDGEMSYVSSVRRELESLVKERCIDLVGEERVFCSSSF